MIKSYSRTFFGFQDLLSQMVWGLNRSIHRNVHIKSISTHSTMFFTQQPGNMRQAKSTKTIIPSIYLLVLHWLIIQSILGWADFLYKVVPNIKMNHMFNKVPYEFIYSLICIKCFHWPNPINWWIKESWATWAKPKQNLSSNFI